MNYLTYNEYKALGGSLDKTAFVKNIDRACGIIDNNTFSRIKNMKTVPQRAKVLCRDLIDLLETSSKSGEEVASRSQSSGSVSESETYIQGGTQRSIDEIIFSYLGSETDDYGVPLLYRGCTNIKNRRYYLL